MRGFTFMATLGVLVAFAGAALGHDFVNGDAAAGGGNHRCTGDPNWIGNPGQSIINQGISIPDPENPEQNLELRVYIHLPPHGPPPNQDPMSPVPGQRHPGILWLESNGLTGFQKNDFVCIATDPGGHADPQVHSDTVIL